jgi:hypothetical protein
MNLPKETAELRADLWDRGRGSAHVDILNNMVMSTRMMGDDLFPPDWSGRMVAHDIAETAKRCELFTMTKEMFDLVNHASRSLPPQTLDVFDLPCDEGFLHLPKPLNIVDVRGNAIPIREVMWSRRTLGRLNRAAAKNLAEGEGVVVWEFVRVGDSLDPLTRTMQRKDLAMLMADVPRSSLMHVQTVGFGHLAWSIRNPRADGTRGEVYGPMQSLHDGTVLKDHGDGTYDVRTMDGKIVLVAPDSKVQFLKAFFHFVQSELSSNERFDVPKVTQKYLRRLEMPMSPVSVVSLRRRQKTDPTGNGWELSYRYLRRGHWRKQWYGSGERKYQRHIWIAPTVVGPDDAPFRERDVVNMVRR